MSLFHNTSVSCFLGLWLPDSLHFSRALRIHLHSSALLCRCPSRIECFPWYFSLPLLLSRRLLWSLLSLPFGLVSLSLNAFRFSLLFLCYTLQQNGTKTKRIKFILAFSQCLKKQWFWYYWKKKTSFQTEGSAIKREFLWLKSEKQSLWRWPISTEAYRLQNSSSETLHRFRVTQHDTFLVFLHLITSQGVNTSTCACTIRVNT